MSSCEPTVATIIKNLTNQDIKCNWIGKAGMCIMAGKTLTLPYDVYTAASKIQRANLDQAIKAKTVEIAYKVRKPITVQRVKSIQPFVMHGEQLPGKAATPPNKANEIKAAAEAAAKARKKQAKKNAKKKAERQAKKQRTEIIRTVGEGKNAIEDSRDLIQKATGQKSMSMQEAMGWEAPATEDTRQPQEAETVTMTDAITEEVGDPLAKAAAAAKKEAQEKARAAKLEAAKKASSTTADAAAAAKKKRSEAAKKAAATRKANKEAAAKAAAEDEGDKE